MSGSSQKIIAFTGDCLNFAQYMNKVYKIPIKKSENSYGLFIMLMDLKGAQELRDKKGWEKVMIINIQTSPKDAFTRDMTIRNITYSHQNPKIFNLLCHSIYTEVKRKWKL